MQIKHPSDPASPQQVSFLLSLLSKKQVEDKWLNVAKHRVEAGVTKGEASQMIEWFKSQPDLPKVDVPRLAKGVYLAANGTVFTVKYSQTSGKPYAMVWDNKARGYRYDGSFYRAHAATAAPLPLANAMQMGLDTGFCVICGRALTDEKSVAQGVGPVCIKTQTGLIASHKAVNP